MTIRIYYRLGNPSGFYLTGVAAHGLCVSDALLDINIRQTWLADARIIEPIKAVKGNAVIPSECHRL